MKLKYPALLALFMAPVTQASDLIISGVYDGPLTGGTPKGVELYVLNDIADLSTCGVGFANNFATGLLLMFLVTSMLTVQEQLGILWMVGLIVIRILALMVRAL